MSSENEDVKQAPENQDTPTEASAEAPAGDEKPEKKPAPKKPAKKAAPKSESSEGEDKPAADKPAEKAPAAEKPAAAAKAAPPKKEEPPPPPEPGRYGQLLLANGFHPTALGNAANGQETLELKANELLEACRFLRDNDGAQFDLLVSVSGVDWQDRLEAVYHLYSTKTFDRLAVKATAVDEKLPSVVSVWMTADWHERETYDLFGIVFEGHPNLKRILMPADWVGYPMRKDYKVEDPRLVWNER